MILHFRAVAWHELQDYLAMGWMVEGEAPGHHSYWSVIMLWPCSCPVPGRPR